MFKNRFLLILGVISLVLVTMAVAYPQSDASLAADQTDSDFHQRHPDWTWTVKDPNAAIAVTGASAFPDYFRRHPELSVSPILGRDASDYFQRHTELITPSILGREASDYFMRHPEVTASAEVSVDLTDYYFRHAPSLPSSTEQALRDYQLGERYGELPQNVALFSAEQIRRELLMGERYGITPQGYAEKNALREYWLGERYGQTP